MKQNNHTPVVHIITKLELGGAQKVCLSLYKGLTQSGTSTYLISGRKGTLVHTLKHNSNMFLLPTFRREISLSHIGTEIRNFAAIVRILRRLKKKHPDLVVHTHSTKAGLVGRWAALFAGIEKRIHTIHGYGFNPHQSRLAWWPTYLLELFTCLITTHYICVSSEDVKTGIKLFPCFAKKHTIIRASIDWQQFYQAARTTDMNTQPVENEPFVFGTVSSFTQPGKNIPQLLHAFAHVHKQYPNTRLEIIGGGVLKKETEKWIKKNKMQHAVILHGWQDKIAPIMLTWHAFTFSSLWEGLPCAIVEARMLKLPVLSYNTGGIHEVIMHGENGFLYQQGDWQSLANGMIELMKNPHLYKKMRAYSDNLTAFNDALMIAQHIQLYQSID